MRTRSSRRVLVTAGPTREALDPVRFISNASTGAQGAALAEEGLSRGYEVDLVHGPLEVVVPAGATAYPVTSAAEMLRACQTLHPACHILIGAAAVSDYRPTRVSRQKTKRTRSPWALDLVPTEDILRSLGQSKGERLHAGFALETESLIENAQRKLLEKNLDWLVANSPRAIGATTADYVLIGADGTRVDLGAVTKRELASRLFDALEGNLGPARRG